MKFDPSLKPLAKNGQEHVCSEAKGCIELKMKTEDGETVFISGDEHIQFIPEDERQIALLIQCDGTRCNQSRLHLPTFVGLSNIRTVQVFDADNDGIKDVVIRMKDGASYLYRGVKGE